MAMNTLISQRQIYMVNHYIGTVNMTMSSPHNLCTTLDTDKEEECLLCMGDRLLEEKSVPEHMAVPQITQDSINQSPNTAQSPSSSRSLVIPVSHDGNAHHIVMY